MRPSFYSMCLGQSKCDLPFHFLVECSPPLLFFAGFPMFHSLQEMSGRFFPFLMRAIRSFSLSFDLSTPPPHLWQSRSHLPLEAFRIRAGAPPLFPGFRHRSLTAFFGVRRCPWGGLGVLIFFLLFRSGLSPPPRPSQLPWRQIAFSLALARVP